MKSHLLTFFTLLYATKSIMICFNKHHTGEKGVPFSHANWLGRTWLASTIHLREAGKTKSRVKSLIPDHFLVNWHKKIDSLDHLFVFLLPKTRRHKNAPMDSVFRSRSKTRKKKLTTTEVKPWIMSNCGGSALASTFVSFVSFVSLHFTSLHLNSRHVTSSIYFLSLCYSSLKTFRANLLISICWFLQIEIF